MSSINDKVFLVSRRWDHHAGHSGYDRLGEFVGRRLTSNPVPDFLLPERLLWKMNHDMLGYDRTSIALELRTLRHMATHKNCLYHLLYGESAYKFLGKFNGWRGHRLVATYHKPPRAFAEMIRSTEPIIKLSALIVVGRNQFASFNDLIPPESLYFVPHPVDTEYFSPPASFQERRENLCLFVGAHLRDYDTLRFVIENSWIAAPQIQFALVIHPLKTEELKGVIGNFRIYQNIGESELLNLYRKASLLIMPLRDTTANNTALEAMACGLPMVVTDIGAIRDYVNDECARFVPPFDHEEMLQTILELLSSRSKLQKMGEEARNHSLKFEWKLIARQMQQVYAQILNSN